MKIATYASRWVCDAYPFLPDEGRQFLIQKIKEKFPEVEMGNPPKDYFEPGNRWHLPLWDLPDGFDSNAMESLIQEIEAELIEKYGYESVS